MACAASRWLANGAWKSSVRPPVQGSLRAPLRAPLIRSAVNAAPRAYFSADFGSVEEPTGVVVHVASGISMEPSVRGELMKNLSFVTNLVTGLDEEAVAIQVSEVGLVVGGRTRSAIVEIAPDVEFDRGTTESLKEGVCQVLDAALNMDRDNIVFSLSVRDEFEKAPPKAPTAQVV